MTCLSGQTFTAPLTRCPRCAGPLHIAIARPQPHGGHLEALINAERARRRP